MVPNPRRILWLVALAVAGAVILLAVWLFRMVSTERALRAVTSSVTVAAAPAPTPPIPAVPAAPLPLPAPAPAPPLHVPAAAAAPSLPAAPTLPVSTASAATPDVEPRKTVKNKKTKAAAKRRESAAARGTFARCPSLGKPGAVMCRWHICNGGAGKEAACRPYLERRP